MATLLGLISGALLAAAAPEAAPEKARRILESPDYQKEFPGEAAEPPEAPMRPFPRRRPSPGESGGILIPAGFSSAVTVTLWCGVAVVLSIVAIAAYRNFRAPRESSGRPPSAGFRAARPEAPPGAGPDPDALAGAGDFAAAIHALLLAALAAARAIRWAPSLTSREILEAPGLPAAARPPLGALVSAAEACHFGTSRPGADDYRRCRDRLSAFRAAFDRRAP